MAELPGYCTKLKEKKANLEARLGKLAPQWAPASIGEAAVESWCDVATNDVAGALRARLGACVGAISQDALGAYRVECPRDSFTATLRLQTNDGRVTRAWASAVRSGERSPASSYDFWRRVGEEATENADECIKKAGGLTLGTVARLLVVVALARDVVALTAAPRPPPSSGARRACRTLRGSSVVGAGGAARAACSVCSVLLGGAGASSAPRCCGDVDGGHGRGMCRPPRRRDPLSASLTFRMSNFAVDRPSSLPALLWQLLVRSSTSRTGSASASSLCARGVSL